jgi:hypothetical protein
VLHDGYEANDKAASCRGRAEGPGDLGGEASVLDVVKRLGDFSPLFGRRTGLQVRGRSGARVRKRWEKGDVAVAGRFYSGVSCWRG